MRRASARVLGLLSLLCLGLGGACSSETDATQLLIVVDSDLSVGNAPDALKTVQVTVLEAGNDGEIVAPQPLALSDKPGSSTGYPLPLSFALTPSGVGEGRSFRVVVTGQNSVGEEIAERQVITAFRAGAALRLDVFLAASCLRKLCREDGQRSALTCDRDTGSCARAPELTDLPIAVGSGVGGYVSLGSKQDGGVSEERDAALSMKCESHSECDDGRFCNGSEECDPGSVKANRMGCVGGIALSCGAQQTCDEANDRCTSCALLPDGDGDHVNAIACGGSDCNDGDPAIAPGHSEVCDGKDNDCDEITDTRAGVSVCAVIDGGADTGPSPGGDAGTDSGVRMDGGSDAGTSDAGRDAGPSDAGMDASAPDTSVPLAARCEVGSTQACSSFINLFDAEVAMGSYGSVMEPNVGRGFEVTLSSGDTPAGCSTFLSTFLSPAEIQAVNDVGTLNLGLHTVYRPARWLAGEKYPLIVWGNGTCMHPEIYGAHLRALASHGFIVVAPNSRFVGTGNAMAAALDFAFAANAEAQGPYNGRIDTTKVGLMGHAQGSQVAITLASDARVQGVLLFGGGRSAVKPFLAISADRDIAGPLADYQSSVNAATKAAYIFFHMVPGTGSADGNLVLIKQPQRVTGAVNAWWKYLLNNDAAARNWFVGASCTLCGHASEYDFGQNGL